jgi:amino acid permease
MAVEKRRIANETDKQRWDRNFADLLQELRVAQTGVQILFAFLLTLPFSNGFPKTNAFQKDVYVAALMAAAFATAMIISPVAFHRALFRQGRKPELVRYAHRMATGGLAFMLVSMVASILLITDYMLNIWVAVALTVVAAGVFVTFWAGIPLARRNWIEQDAQEDQEIVGVDARREDDAIMDGGGEADRRISDDERSAAVRGL